MEMVKNWIYRIGQTPTWLSLFLGGLLIVLQWQMGYLPTWIEQTFFVLLMALVGIPHGAIDHLVEKETAERLGKSFKMSFFLAQYLVTMLLYALVWLFLPGFSLVFFLLISAWHFGETDIEKAPPSLAWHTTRFLFGALVLAGLLLTHTAETTPILTRITQNNTSIMACWQWSVGHSGFVLGVLGVLCLFFGLVATIQNPLSWQYPRLLRLLGILVLTYFLPLLPAFALYFGGWHALCSFQNICHYLLRNRLQNADTIPVRAALQVWRQTLGFSVMACLGLGLAAWFWTHFLQSWDPLPVLFIFLSIITLPHLTVMHGMLKRS